MKQTIEKQSIPKESNADERRERMAGIIRDKLQRGLTLTGEERAFYEAQKEDYREGDNPRYGH